MKMLTEAAIRQYQEQGYYAPIRVMPRQDADALRGKLEAFEAGAGVMAGKLRHKSHLLFTWLNDLVRHPRILDAVEDVIGPNILCWGSRFFIKEPRNPGFVSWHQDFDLLGAGAGGCRDGLGGAVRQHRRERRHAGDPRLATRWIRCRIATRSAPENLLSRGQEIMVEVDERQAAMLELQAGEMSLHHVRLIHGSDPNPSGLRRIGFAIRYIPTTVRQIAGTHDHATLVRGVDTYGNFEPEERPDADMSERAVAFHAAVTGAHAAILMRETGKEMRV